MSRFYLKSRSQIFTIALLIVVISFSLISSVPLRDNPYIPDIGAFMKIGRNLSPAYDISSEALLFKGNMSGVYQIHRINESGWPYQLTTFDDGIDWFRVSRDGSRAVAGVSTGGSEQSQLFLIDTKSGRSHQLTDNPLARYGSVVWKKDGNGFYYRSNVENLRDFKIYYYNLTDGSQTKILDLEGSNSILDISYDERFLVIALAHSNNDVDLFLYDTETGQYRQVTPEGKQARFTFPSISKDNMTLYLVSDDNDDGIMRRAKINLESGKFEWIDKDTEWMTEILDFSNNRKFMIDVINEDGYSKINLYDTEENATLPSPDIAGMVENPVLLDDGRLFFVYSNPSRTDDIWLWNYRTEELKQLTFATYSGIDQSDFVEPILIRYKSFDGLEIPAFMYLPPDYDGSPVPFIIAPHGGPELQSRPYFVRNFQYFLLNGFGIMSPNIRGSKGYGKKYLDMDNYKNRMKSIKDIKAGVDYLIENGYTAKGKIGIMGGSYGGFVVLASITEYPDLYSAAVDRVGIANFVTFLQNTKDYRRHIREAEYGPLTDEEFLKSISPIHKAHLIKTPLLVTHGENDPRVPISEARQIINAVSENNGIVDSLFFADEGHVFVKQSNKVALYRKIAEFFNKYLKD